MNNNFIKSSLDKSSKAFLKETILVEKLVEGYQNQFGIDISRYFKDITEIGLYECTKTKYRFYYPYGIDGDSDFYQKLQKFSWYYVPWKWEHEITFKQLGRNEKILEVGSGGLGFIEKMHNYGFNMTGLELNADSSIKAKEIGLEVFNETIQVHATKNFEKYDVVCSYQVLEHIDEVNPFIKAQVDCLKKGGKLIISVPNNDSFLKFTSFFLLNMPPHHMGLWNKKSLYSLTKVFNIRIEKLYYEPLQQHHFDWYINSTIEKKINKYRIIKIAFNKMRLKKIYSYIIKKSSNYICGHTVLAIYTKL